MCVDVRCVFCADAWLFVYVSVLDMSRFYDSSIQQSPIDPVFEYDSEEEGPLTPPREMYEPAASLADMHDIARTFRQNDVSSATHAARIIVSREWIHQLGDDPLVGECGLIVFSHSDKFLGMKHPDGRVVRVSLCGTVMYEGHSNSSSYLLFEKGVFGASVPEHVLEIYMVGYKLVENWRSRVVCLSMESNEIETSLMDDLFPPRSLLTEYKNNIVLRSMKIEKGLVTINTVVRTLTVPLNLIEEDCLTHAVKKIAPELAVIDMEEIWDNFIKLRQMCLEQHQKHRHNETYIHGG